MNLVLFLTNTCNFKCSYCFVEKEKKFLEFETYLKIIDEYKDKVNRITFFGGEPLLCLDMIKNIIKYNDENNINVNYNINTNGYLINDEVLKLCKKYNILLNASIDGNKESNILNRCTEKEFDILYKNIKEANDQGIDVYINYVVTPNTLDYLVDGTKFLIEEGFKKICYMFNYDTKWEKEELEYFDIQLKEIVTYLVKTKSKVKLLPLSTKKTAIMNDKEVSKCNFGEDSLVSDTEGNIYPCMNFIGNKKFKRQEKEQKYKNTVNIKKCINCNYVKFCSNNCMCKGYKKDMYNDYDINCELERIYIRNALEYNKKILFGENV